LIKKPLITKVACGCYHSAALCENGNIYTFGRGNHGQLGHGNTDDQKLPKMISSLSDKKVIDIAGGFYHTIVLVKNRKARELCKLSSDMRKIVNDATRADVTFLLDGKPIHAHRAILMVRCPKLHERIVQEGRLSDERDKKKWGSSMKQHWTVYLDAYSQKAFLNFVEYLYTDAFP